MTKRWSVVALCVLVAVLASSGVASAQERWAVICGVSDYEHFKDLEYCDDDAEDLAAALLKYPEWSADHITVLTDADATYVKVRDAIAAMALIAQAGDLCLFAFSGHGTQVLDTSGDEGKRDTADEAICPHDTRIEGGYIYNVITDDRLGEWLAALPGDVVAIIDTCFSGGMAEGGKGLTAKSVRNPAVPADAKVKRGFGRGLARRLAARGGKGKDAGAKDIGGPDSVVLMACEENKLSYESPTLANGLFSYYVVDGIEGGKADLPPTGDANGLLSAEEDFDYAKPRTQKAARGLPGGQRPQLYDGNPYAQAAIVEPGPPPPPPPPPGSLSVTVETDKGSYTDGEPVTITVSVTDDQGSPVEDALVKLTIKPRKGKPDKREANTDSHGTVTFPYLVNTAQGGTGTYKVTATASKDGATGEGSATFEVVP